MEDKEINLETVKSDKIETLTEEASVEKVSLTQKMEQLKEFLHEHGLVLIPKISYKEFALVPEIEVGLKKENDTVRSA